MVAPTIKVSTAPDEGPVIAVEVLAFSVDPAARWLWPDPQQYVEHFPNFVRAFGGQAFVYRSAYYVDGYAGAALWLPPNVHPDDAVLIPLLKRTVPEPIQADAFAVFEAMERYHPLEPHWYLPLIGVDPLHQGQGYGTALMQHALLPCDRDKTLAFLETANRKNIPFYERYGFEVLGTIQRGTSPPLYPMLRAPR
jgi:ribosomal protein S18 acetylase RimI-like enzyme